MVCNTHGLHDTQTHIHPDNQAFTHYNKAHKTFTSIDKIFVSINLLHGLQKTNVSQCAYSVHRLVWVELINQETIRKGPGLLAMNNSVLNDNAYKKFVSKSWEGWRLKKEGFNNLLIWWDDSLLQRKTEDGKDVHTTIKTHRKTLITFIRTKTIRRHDRIN